MLLSVTHTSGVDTEGNITLVDWTGVEGVNNLLGTVYDDSKVWLAAAIVATLSNCGTLVLGGKPASLLHTTVVVPECVLHYILGSVTHLGLALTGNSASWAIVQVYKGFNSSQLVRNFVIELLWFYNVVFQFVGIIN